MTNTTPTVEYPASWKAAIARFRRIMKRNGIPLGKIEGRYYPIGGGQTFTAGVKATRVGCSTSIAVDWVSDNPSRSRPGEGKAVVAEALAVARAEGMPFDERGWLKCTS